MPRASMIAASLSAVIASATPWVCGTALAQESAAPAPAVDPAAMAAVDRMSAYLATLPVFEVTSDASRDVVLDGGPTVKLGVQTRYVAQLPRNLYAEVHTDRQHRNFYFDGQTLTMTAPRLAYYGSVSAAGSVGDLVTTLSDTYGVDLPLADLFLWNARRSEVRPTTASVIGYADVDGQETDQYAFSSPTAEWQIWVKRGDQPLPLRMVVTDATDPARPQFAADLTWNLSPRVAPGQFAFSPPEGARRITVGDMSAAEGDQ